MTIYQRILNKLYYGASDDPHKQLVEQLSYDLKHSIRTSVEHPTATNIIIDIHHELKNV